ncbi:hypothetical protein CRG98_024687 [Punica granatum]|uniref:Aminotransferase-like plant mobile domain-containing protein n=1 Tax=Punica granatum TaxID=22663 RepID=A0A2I0JF67_PUNGR|nr:hypothetical protein CRG98_024687 [Punica granatum]
MDRSHPCLRLNVIITPAAYITRLWRTFRPIDRAFLRLIIGDLPLLADSPIDWTLLRTAISFWDTQRAVFDFQGTEFAPTVEEYTALILLIPPFFLHYRRAFTHRSFTPCFYEFGKLDACGVRVSFRSSTSRSIPPTKSELSQLSQRTWCSSISRDSHLFVGIAWHKFRWHRGQTFQRQRAPPKEPCARSCSPLGKSEIDSAESLSRHVQSSRIRESCRES